MLANAGMTASGLVGTWRGGWTTLAVGCLALASALVLLPVALVAREMFWIRFAPLAIAVVPASAALIMVRFRRSGDRRPEIALAAVAIAVGTTSVIVQVGLLGAAALVVLICPLAAAAVMWRARGTPAVFGHHVAIGRLASRRRVLPGPVATAAIGAVVVAVVIAGATAGPVPTLALVALLGLLVGALLLRLAVPAVEARSLTAVLSSLAIAAVPFRGLVEIQVGGIALGATEVLLAGAVAVWLVGRDARRGQSVPELALGMLIFSGWLVVTAFAAVNPALVLKEVLKWIQIAAALVILADVMREPSARRIVAWTVGVAVLTQAGLGLVQTALQAGPGGFVVGGVLRAFGTFDQPNPYGGYLGIHAPLILAAAIYARGSRRRWLVLLGIVVLVGVIASRSRGAWLGMGASSLVVVLAAGHRTRPWARTALGAVAAGVLAFALAALVGVFDGTLPPDVERTIQGEHPVADAVRHRAHDDFAIAQRVAHWAAGWRMFQDHPLLGVGAGNFDDAYRAYALHPFDEPLGHAHNVALTFGAEAGLLGMLMFVGLSLWAFWTAVAAVRRSRGAAIEWSVVGALGALVGFAIHNLVDSLFVSGMGIVFALILSLALGARPRESTAMTPRVAS